MYREIVRWWLTVILLIFPFLKIIMQYFDGMNFSHIKYVKYIDESTIVILLLPAVIELYRRKGIHNYLYLIIPFPILIFCLFGLTSGIVNGNPIVVSILGTIDYVKYFLVIFIYAAFFREFSDYNRMFRFLLFLAIFLSFLAIIEVIWAMVSRYMLGKDLLDPSMYLFRAEPPSEAQSFGSWRYGVYRAGSIMKKIDWLGYFSLFMLTIYMSVKKKWNPYILFMLLSGILLSVSRSAYAGLLVMLIVFFISRKVGSRKLVVIFIMIVIFTISILGFNTSSILNPRGNDVVTYRDYSAQKSMEIWEDYPLIGVGPGMFGGIVSRIFVSPIYKEYKISFARVKLIGGIDQFWPQLIAETGIIGTVLFAFLFVALIKLLLLLRKETGDEDSKRLLSGLLLFLLSIYVYNFSTGFNTIIIMFPYFAFVGISLGSITELKRNDLSC